MAPPRGGGAAGAAAPAPVLIIEDEAAIVELLSAIMADLPAEISSARSAAQAFAMLPPAGRRPALITLDLVLPDSDGFRILAEIRRRRELDDVPVIVLSAQTDHASQKRAYAGGASDFIAKPFSIELLDAKLRAWLRLSRLAAQPQQLRDLLHEARNPLSAIGSAAQVLARPDADEAMRLRMARAIESEADRLGRMLARLEPGAEAAEAAEVAEARSPARPPAPPVQTDVAALLGEIAEFNVAEPAARARLQLDAPRDGSLPAVRVDADRLRQMLLNLIDNALAATAAGGAVLIEAGAEEGGVVVSVSDTGPGIAAADRARIFEDGFTTRAGAARGLGLGITQRLCHAVGARLRVDSEPGHGATFTLWLPR